MTDLTTITTPFGLLDRETQEALKAHGGPYEIWQGNRWGKPARENAFDGWYAYRVTRPAPPTPRTIFTCEVHGECHVHDTAMVATKQALEFQHGEATVTEWEEKLK